jgi:hypothetical protein
MTTEPIDVLAVMKNAEDDMNETPYLQHHMFEARHAVAELIEAAEKLLCGMWVDAAIEEHPSIEKHVVRTRVALAAVKGETK